MELLRERRWRIALELSVLAHLLLAWLAPMGHTLVAAMLPAEAPTPLVKPQQKADEPIRFELVDLPDQREETPSRHDAPGSDLSRRAHGGEGASADRPGMAGTTYDLRLAPGQQSQIPAPAPAPPRREQRAPQPRPTATVPEPDVQEGRAAVIRREEPTPADSRPTLKGISPFSAPPPTTGGAVPDRTGGQVDLGPLSFDTQWYDWGPYAAEMLRRIRYHWNIPEIARLGVQGVVRIRFLISRDGTVSGLEIQRESSHPPMDFAARDAILNASPLPPLPADLTGIEREGVTITFYYNVRPPER